MIGGDFDSMMRTSYRFNEHEFIKDGRWNLLRDLYNNNYLGVTDCDTSVLPKKIHQIWLGGKLPDKFRRYSDSWIKHHPDWEYKLWGDEDARAFKMMNRTQFDASSHVAQKSDIFRYEILRREGGLYVDTDFECLKPFDELAYLNFFTGIAYNADVELFIGLIGSTPGNPIINHLLKRMVAVRHRDWKEVFDTTGTYFFTRCFFEAVKESRSGVVAFPPDYFYPFPNQEGHASRRGMDYIKDCSYALHHWAVSWS